MCSEKENNFVETVSVGRVYMEMLGAYTLPQLAALYFELTEDKIEWEVFDSRQRAERLVRDVLKDRFSPPPPTERKVKFNRPYRGRIVQWRKGTIRDKIITLLTRPEGATFEECQAVTTKGTYQETYGQLYLIWDYVGFGLREDPNGHIHIHTEEYH